MSGCFKQMQHGRGEAQRQLEERLARKEMGDAEYAMQATYADNRAFKIFGVVFIVVFGIVVFVVAALD